MHLSSRDIENSLKQGRNFIFVEKADIDIEKNTICTKVCVPEQWRSQFVSPSLVVEAMGQSSEILIRYVYKISNVMYLMQIHKLRNSKMINMAEEFQNIEVISKVTQIMDNVYFDTVKAFIGEECICYAEIHHCVVY